MTPELSAALEREARLKAELVDAHARIQRMGVQINELDYLTHEQALLIREFRAARPGAVPIEVKFTPADTSNVIVFQRYQTGMK